MPVAIRVENLSKAYQLGNFSTGTVSRDLERLFARLRGKEDPFLKIGEINDRSLKGGSDVVWSLKDLSFDIEQGDAVGIIGRNGAGKSTLLKILSRVTAPTTGSVKVKGRIASLLEVGTGFHPELTGRENIYLNGAILGMRRAETKRKFDEIVAFSGVERYIDTPVKRYSSGMYVRLAFAVAAHLESEILIVDEVLAVGDAEFQAKCLGKMGEVSKGEGRTVLFVSHNMAAVQKLCNAGMFLLNGRVEATGSPVELISKYTKPENEINVNQTIAVYGAGDQYIRLVSIKVVSKSPSITVAEGFQLIMNVELLDDAVQPNLNISFNTVNNEPVFMSICSRKVEKQGLHSYMVSIPDNFLNNMDYHVIISAATHKQSIVHFQYETALTVKEVYNHRLRYDYTGAMPGGVRPELAWQELTGMADAV